MPSTRTKRMSASILIRPVLAISFLAVGCGGGIDELADIAAESASEPSADTVATSATSSGPATTIAASTALTAALKNPYSGSGWPVPAGRWHMTLGEEALAFETRNDLELLVEADGLVELNGLLGTVTLFELAAVRGVVGSDGFALELPVPDDLGEWLADRADVNLGESGILSEAEDLPWWDVTITPDAATEVCSGGERCVPLLDSRGGQVVGQPGDRLRIVDARAIGGAMVVATGEANNLATELAGTLSAVAANDPAGPRFLRSLGVAQGIPAGQYVLRLDDGSFVELSFAEPRDELWLVFSGPRSAIFVGPDDLVLTVQQAGGLFDPAAEQSLESLELLDETDVPDSFGGWLDAMVTVVDTGSTLIAGRPATWWDITVSDGDPSSPCGPERTPSGAGDCTNLMLSDSVFLANSESTTRWIKVDDTDVVIVIGTQSWIGDVPLAAAAPLLDSIVAIEPAG